MVNSRTERGLFSPQQRKKRGLQNFRSRGAFPLAADWKVRAPFRTLALCPGFLNPPNPLYASEVGPGCGWIARVSRFNSLGDPDSYSLGLLQVHKGSGPLFFTADGEGGGGEESHHQFSAYYIFIAGCIVFCSTVCDLSWGDAIFDGPALPSGGIPPW